MLTLLAITLPTVLAQAAPNNVAKFNGTWNVEVITEQGLCDRSYRSCAIIERGAVRDADGDSFTIDGRVQADGTLRGSITRGSARADVVGSLSEQTGSGTWTASGLSVCSGRWNAERRDGEST